MKPKLFSECSVEELRKAVMRLRMPTANTPTSAEERALFDQYLEAVTSRFDKGSPVRVQMRNPEGTTLIDFKGIPMTQVDKLAEALTGLLFPVLELPEMEGEGKLEEEEEAQQVA